MPARWGQSGKGGFVPSRVSRWGAHRILIANVSASPFSRPKWVRPWEVRRFCLREEKETVCRYHAQQLSMVGRKCSGIVQLLCEHEGMPAPPSFKPPHVPASQHAPQPPKFCLSHVKVTHSKRVRIEEKEAPSL